MEQGKMFAFIGITMAILQGGYVRKIPEEKTHASARLVKLFQKCLNSG
jgi:hypothetical protein